MNRTTEINGREIPVYPEGSIAISFVPGSKFKGDEGDWTFWTILRGTEALITARWRKDEPDPGERFRRLKGTAVWPIVCTADGIRSATNEEVVRWLDSHPDESPYAETFEEGVRTGRVARTPLGYRLEGP